MDEPRIGVSFDLSRRSTGWVRWEERTPVDTGVIELPAGVLGQQISMFRTRMLAVLPRRLDWVAVEDTRVIGKRYGLIYFALNGLLHEACWNRGVPILGFPQTTVKKALTDNGHASKDEMLTTANILCPSLDIDTDDQADALAVGMAFWLTQPEGTGQGG